MTDCGVTVPIDATPLESGYVMPAEWERHSATWISWPKNPYSFPKEILPEVEESYLGIITALAKGETVNLLVDDELAAKRIESIIESRGINSNNVRLHRIRTSDVWFRDYGPIFVKNCKTGNIAYTHWEFNAWGGKYDDLKQDCTVPKSMPLQGLPKFDVPMVLEGGSIDVNGLGTCLTTEQCLLNRNRNPSMDRGRIESYLRDYLGATHVVWLGNGLEGDDTDGHVDDLARFVSKDTVVCAYEEDESDSNHAALEENFRILENATDQAGSKIDIVKIPMPKAVVYEGQRLPASYTNFYVANGAVLVPTFRDANDDEALGVLKRLFKTREVIGIDCRSLVYGFGAIHCVTQQQPA